MRADAGCRLTWCCSGRASFLASLGRMLAAEREIVRRTPMRGLSDYFALLVHGEDFDVERYLASSRALQFGEVWHRGDQRPVCRESAYVTSGGRKLLGDGTRAPIAEQERVAINFLMENQEAVRGLADIPGAAYRTLGLEYFTQVGNGSPLGFAFGPSSQLMKLALELRIQLTFYVTLGWSEEAV
jgi:hypothetical protein